jgi:hypothetical protein
LTSRIDDESVGEGAPSPGETLMKLRSHIAALESELASYASRYGLTDRARKLLARPTTD